MPAPTPDDLYRLAVPSDLQRGPDGRVVFVVKRALRDHDRYAENLHVAGEGEWTHGEWNDTHPRWSPDGRWLALLSNREDVTKPPTLWVMPACGGEPRRVWDRACEGFAWSPDGARFVVVHRPAPEARPVRVFT